MLQNNLQTSCAAEEGHGTACMLSFLLPSWREGLKHMAKKERKNICSLDWQLFAKPPDPKPKENPQKTPTYIVLKKKQGGWSENILFCRTWVCHPLVFRTGSCWCVQAFWDWQHWRERLSSICITPSTEDTEIFKLMHALSWHSTESDANFWKIEEPQGRLITALLKNVRQLLPPTVKESE